MAKLDTFESLSKAKGFKLGHLNIRSLVKKMDQVRLMLSNSDIDVFSLSETWLKSHLHSGLVELEGYNMFRLDRGTRGKKRGGGLVTYINTKYSEHCESLSDLNASDEHVEAQWVQIHRPHCKNVVMCNIYRPPNGDLKKAILYLENCLLQINMDKTNLFLMEDMNVNYKNKSTSSYKRLNFFLQSNGLTQHVHNTTRNTDKTKSLLDLAVTNSSFVSQAGVLDHFISDHQPIYILHKKGRDSRKSVSFEGRSYRNFNRDDFRKKLVEKEWTDMYNTTSPDLAWDRIQANILEVLDEMCPIRSFCIKNYRPDWMTKELIEQIKDRDYFFKKAKSDGNEDSWNIAKYLRNLTNSNIRQARREFVLSELKENESDAKKFWKVIRGIIPSDKKTGDNNILLKDRGTQIVKEGVAHFINDYFVNIGNFVPPDNFSSDEISTEPSSPEQDHPNASAFTPAWKLTKVTETEVFKVIRDINVSKSSGLDNISSFIVKEAFLALVPETTFMLNLSIASSTFPNVWKEALVIPIPKSGNLTQVKNYRPISLLPLPGKVLEKLIHGQISGYLETAALLSDCQHGFRKDHSTIHSVAQFTSYVNSKMDSRMPTLVTYIDFRKAFDCVQHYILLRKLSSLGLDNSVVQWVESYLSSRKQRVYANGIYSSFLPVTQGVPQGSVLGPLFYIIYANDLVNLAKNCKVAMYADDTVFYTANSNFDVSVAKMQADVNSLSNWCNSNGIMVNTDKTKLMTFGNPNLIAKLAPFEVNYEGTPMQKVTSYKYLGVTLDSQLSYNLHVNKIIATASNKLKQFRRMRSFLDVRAAIMVYKSMILPLLEYGDIFLSAATVINRKRLQTLQNKGLKCALNKNPEYSSSDLHEEADLLMLKYRREQHLLNFMYSWSQDPQKLKTIRSGGPRTRSTKKKLLKLKRPRTERFKKSFAYMGAKKWNQLPAEFHEALDKKSYRTHVSRLVTCKAAGLNESGV